MKKQIKFAVFLLMTLGMGLSAQGAAPETAGKFTLAQRRTLFTEGVNAFQDKQYEAARQSFEGLREQYPELQDYVEFFLADTYLNLGENQKALAACQQFLKKYPVHPVAAEVRFKTANLLLGEQRYPEAIALYQNLLEHSARDQGNLYYQLGKAQAGMGNDKEAVFALQQVIAFHPDFSSLAEAQQDLQQILQKAPQLKPQWTEDTLFNHAQALFQLGRHKQALTQYEAFRKQYPQSKRLAECAFGMADAYFRLRNKKDGLNVLEKLAAQYQTANPEIAARALYQIGVKHWGADENAQAQAYMQRIVKAYPQTSWSATARYVLGRIAQDGDAYPEAAKWYAAVYETQPRSEFAEEALWRAGWALYLAQQYAPAEKLFAQARAAFPNGDYVNDALYWQGRTCEKMPNRPAALKMYQQLAQSAPSTYYGILAQKRLRLLNVPAAVPAKQNGEIPAVAVVLQALQPMQPPARYDEIARHVSKILEFQAIQLTGYAVKEIEWLAALDSEAGQTPGRPPLLTYLLSRLYAGIGKYLPAIQCISELETALKQSAGQAFPFPWEKLKYPLAYWELIRKYAQANNLDPFLVAAVIRQESAYDPAAVSSANAKGLMQLMTFTGKHMAQKLGWKKFDVAQLYAPEINIQLGTQYLTQLLEQYDNNLYRTLAAYNAGPDSTKKWWPDKGANDQDAQEVIVENITYRATRLYIKQVLRSQHYYRVLYGEGL